MQNKTVDGGSKRSFPLNPQFFPRGEANVLLEATPRNSDALVVQW